MKKKIVGAALGTCVHVSGLYHFLKSAEAAGYETILLAPPYRPNTWWRPSENTTPISQR